MPSLSVPDWIHSITKDQEVAEAAALREKRFAVPDQVLLCWAAMQLALKAQSHTNSKISV
jgi:hypothetical protein